MTDRRTLLSVVWCAGTTDMSVFTPLATHWRHTCAATQTQSQVHRVRVAMPKAARLTLTSTTSHADVDAQRTAQLFACVCVRACVCVCVCVCVRADRLQRVDERPRCCCFCGSTHPTILRHCLHPCSRCHPQLGALTDEIAVVKAWTRVSGWPTARAYVFLLVRQNSMTGLHAHIASHRSHHRAPPQHVTKHAHTDVGARSQRTHQSTKQRQQPPARAPRRTHARARARAQAHTHTRTQGMHATLKRTPTYPSVLHSTKFFTLGTNASDTFRGAVVGAT